RDHRTKLHQHKMLHAIRDHLPARLKQRYAELVHEFGEPEHPDFLVWMSGGWIGPTSPVGSTEISQMGPTEFSRYVESWQPESDFMAPSREGLGRALQDVVAQNPSLFANQAGLFALPHLHGVYAYHFLMGIREAHKAERLFPMEPVVALCETRVGLRAEAVRDEV